MLPSNVVHFGIEFAGCGYEMLGLRLRLIQTPALNACPHGLADLFGVRAYLVA